MTLTLLWLSACTLGDQSNPSDLLQQAQSLIESKEYQRAEDLLTPLLNAEGQFRRLALFGLANIAVLQASSQMNDAPSLLPKAIAWYRAAMEGETNASIIRDARHNILVAKSLLRQRPRETKSQSERLNSSKEDPDATQKSETSASQADLGQGTESNASNAAESKRVENIKRETPAIADRDPGKLTPKQASEWMEQAESRRIKSDSSDAGNDQRRPNPRDR